MKTPRSHDALPGRVSHCQVCFSETLELVIDLGHQPLCDSLLTKEELDGPETNYPLRLFRCLDCGGAQLDYVVPGEIVYHKSYPYRCGITQEVVDHHNASSKDVVQRFKLDAASLVVDVGSNDGTLLKGFKAQGVRVLGVEPTDIGKIAREDGIETIQSFFNETVAKEIRKEYGAASVVTATNVFAHMATLGQVMGGVTEVLKDGGIFIVEIHNLIDIIKGVQYDTVYHEHLRSYSLKSLVRLFEQYSMTVVDANRVERYAGSLRVFVMKGKDQKVSDNVKRLLAEEESFGLFKPEVFRAFAERSYRARDQLLELAISCRKKGMSFVGNSCPGRSSTLVNFTGITKDMMPYVAEQPTSLKIGLHMPGKHMPIVNNEILFKEQPDYVLLLAWHYWEPITKLLRARGLKSKLVVPLPELRIID